MTLAAAQWRSGSASNGLVGHWPLRGDCRDHSGNERHAVNHGVQLEEAAFDGRSRTWKSRSAPRCSSVPAISRWRCGCSPTKSPNGCLAT